MTHGSQTPDTQPCIEKNRHWLISHIYSWPRGGEEHCTPCGATWGCRTWEQSQESGSKQPEKSPNSQLKLAYLFKLWPPKFSNESCLFIKEYAYINMNLVENHQEAGIHFFFFFIKKKFKKQELWQAGFVVTKG